MDAHLHERKNVAKATRARCVECHKRHALHTIENLKIYFIDLEIFSLLQYVQALLCSLHCKEV